MSLIVMERQQSSSVHLRARRGGRPRHPAVPVLAFLRFNIFKDIFSDIFSCVPCFFRFPFIDYLEMKDEQLVGCTCTPSLKAGSRTRIHIVVSHTNHCSGRRWREGGGGVGGKEEKLVICRGSSDQILKNKTPHHTTIEHNSFIRQICRWRWMIFNEHLQFH